MTNEVNRYVALVTGANRGIGKAITEGLLDAGAVKVYAAVRDLSSVNEPKGKYGERVIPLEFDLTRKETIDGAAGLAGDVNLVVANAGVLKASSPVDADAVLTALRSEDFFAYPDPMAQQVSKVYQPFAQNILEIPQ